MNFVSCIAPAAPPSCLSGGDTAVDVRRRSGRVAGDDRVDHVDVGTRNVEDAAPAAVGRVGSQVFIVVDPGWGNESKRGAPAGSAPEIGRTLRATRF